MKAKRNVNSNKPKFNWRERVALNRVLWRVPKKYRAVLLQCAIEMESKNTIDGNGYQFRNLCRNRFCADRGHCAIFENGYDVIHIDWRKLNTGRS